MTNDTIAKTIQDVELNMFLDLVAPLRALVALLDSYDETTATCDPSDAMLVVKTCLQQTTRMAEGIHEAMANLENLYARSKEQQLA